MQKYRKSDQYYIDKYDRMTISELKGVEKLEKQAEKKFENDLDDTGAAFIGLTLRINDIGVRANRNKRTTINEWIARDERKDRLIQKYPIPFEPTCNVCNNLMQFVDYDFINDDTEILFLFSCLGPKKHNKMLYASGMDYNIPKKLCPYCNGEVKTVVKKAKDKISCTDKCKACTWSDTSTFDIRKKTILIGPVNEDDRKKYCTNFINGRTFLESLSLIASIKFTLKDEANTKQIEILKLPQVEELLIKSTESKGYVKFLFEQPEITGHVTVKFSVQDPTERTSEKSAKTLKRIIEDALLKTNWRLMNPAITCRLGFLNGRIKGFDLEEDLIKIANEIDQKKSIYKY